MLVYDNCACDLREVETPDPDCDVVVPHVLYLTYEGKWEVSLEPTRAQGELTYLLEPVVLT